jgi:colanic acid/amylovoran biosynthesis protein
MNIVIDNGSYRMDNMGDVAMLQVCVRRLRARWPQATVQVVVDTPDRLRQACPGTTPLVSSRWPTLPVVPRLQRWRGERLRRLERLTSLHAPGLARMGKRRHIRFLPDVARRFDDFYEAVCGADAVVCSGGGFFNDWHADHADKVLHTLALAQARHIPTAMFGAGLGPLGQGPVRDLARPVLGRLVMLSLREGQAGPRELAAWGVPLRRILVTGDDAVELAYGRRNDRPGSALGFNVRLAAHAQAPPEQLRTLGPAMLALARELEAPLVALPVRNRLSPDNDLQAMQEAFGAAPVDMTAAQAVSQPVDLVELISQCRLVVTGAYHAGVFALSQGIPVVALSGGRYYDSKFAGLREQFGAGIQILRYDQPDLLRGLAQAVRSAWTLDSSCRRSLLSAARQQIEAGHHAYDTFMDWVERRRTDGVRRPGGLTALSRSALP